MLDEFIGYLEEQLKNHSIYIWGAQGQSSPTLSETWIKKKETGIHRTDALRLYRKAVNDGYGPLMRAFDCSGLGMYWLQQLKKLSKADMNSNGMKAKCRLVSRNELKRGCWVFRTYKSGKNKGRAYHIGYVVDDDLNVIEARGRAYGVVKRKFDGNYWNTFGVPSYFESEITSGAYPAVFAENLKKGSKGESVKALQRLLNRAGDYQLAEDGIFGTKTYKAVKDFQKSRGLKKDGIAGINTITALGGEWLE